MHEIRSFFRTSLVRQMCSFCVQQPVLYLFVTHWSQMSKNRANAVDGDEVCAERLFTVCYYVITFCQQKLQISQPFYE